MTIDRGAFNKDSTIEILLGITGERDSKKEFIIIDRFGNDDIVCYAGRYNSGGKVKDLTAGM